jgi:transcriptional regulator with XRE-family HTH domain
LEVDMALPIRGNVLQELRHRQGMRLNTLAERSGVSRDSIWRIENGLQPGNREDTQKRLARALGVEPEVLTGQKRLPEEVVVPRGRWVMEVSVAARNAAILAARRYRVPEALIVELAPLLFVLAAEESLGRRRAVLAEVEAALEKAAEAGEGMPHLAGIGVPPDAVRAGLVAEEASISARDLFAAELDADAMAELGDAGGDAGVDNPFAALLAERARRASVGAFDLATVMRVTPSHASMAVCGGEALAATGGDRVLTEAILAGYIALGEMPGSLWEHEVERVEWLRGRMET